MSALKVADRGPSRRVVVLLLLAVATGLGVGWCLPAARERSFDYAYALLAPALMSVACVRAVTTNIKQRGVVPVFLALAIVNVTTRPHVPALSALSIAAAVVATVAAVGNRRVTAVVSVIVAFISVSASLLLGLRTG